MTDAPLDVSTHAVAAPEATFSPELLCVFLGSAEYALPVAAVRAILDLTDTVPLPRAPDGVRGIVSWRDEIVPVFELGAVLGVPSCGEAATESLLVLALGGPASIVGCVVDRVSGLAAGGDRPFCVLQPVELHAQIQAMLAGSP